MKTVSINLYSFSELNENAQQKAVEQHAEFLQSIGVESENEAGEMETDYDYVPTREEVIDNIEANEYIFFADGELASCTTYTGGHAKSGITEFKFHGQVITL